MSMLVLTRSNTIQKEAVRESDPDSSQKYNLSGDANRNSLDRIRGVITHSPVPRTLSDGQGVSKLDSQIPSLLPISSSTPFNYTSERERLVDVSNSRPLVPPVHQPATPTAAHHKTISRLANFDDSDHDNDSVNVNVISSPANYSDRVSVSNLFEDDQGSNVTPPLMTITNPSKNVYRFIASCCWQFCLGATDGSVGALLPSIEAHYAVTYAVVSLIWLANCIGFILIASTSHFVTKHLKLKTAVFISTLLQVIQFSIASSGTKFPAFVFSYFIGGVAAALGLSRHNYYISRFDKASTCLGILHGSYGIGATVGPLIATLMISHKLKWHFFFLVLLGVTLANCFTIFFSFRDSDADFLPFELAEESDSSIQQETNSSAIQLRDMTSSKPRHDHEGNVSKAPNDFTLAVKLIKTWLMSFWVLFYQGLEVGFGSWVVTFFLKSKKGHAGTTGYISSGFWAGITISRFVVTPLASKYLGSRRSIIVLGIMAIIFDVLTWTVSNIYASAVMAAFNGVVVGPMYPLMIGLVPRILPRKVQVISMTIMMAFGSSGGALFPFIIGLLTQFIGTYVMHPMFIALTVAMVITWVILPNVERIDKAGPPKNFLQYIW